MFDFDPPLLFRNRHFQTVISPLTRSFGKPVIDEEIRIPIEPSGELIGKLWKAKGRNRLAMIYHGLGGHENAPYVLGATKALFENGYSVLRMRLRGAEQEPPITSLLYHAGLTADVDRAVAWVQNEGYERIFLVGFSLSANTVLKWLGEGRRKISAAFTVSPPVRLSTCADIIDLPRNIIYQKYFLKKLRESVERKSKAFPTEFMRYLRPQHFHSIRSFDEHITSVFHGFHGAAEYYEKAASYPTLNRIENQVAILHSLDDPFVESSDLKYLEKSTPENIVLKLFSRGGHVGFYEGLFRGYKIDPWVVDYFSRWS